MRGNVAKNNECITKHITPPHPRPTPNCNSEWSGIEFTLEVWSFANGTSVDSSAYPRWQFDYVEDGLALTHQDYISINNVCSHSHHG